MSSGARYLLAPAGDSRRDHEGVHDGNGVIAIQSMFAHQNRMGIYFHVWELEPGASEGRHTHAAGSEHDDFEEFYYVMSGRAVATFDGEDVILSPGDALLVPPDVNHGIENQGDVPVRLLLVFGSPREDRP